MEIYSLKSRYISKLTNNLLGAIIGFITLPLVTRALKAEGLGIFDYSTESMRILLDLLSFGVPTAIFAWLSRETGDKAKSVIIFGRPSVAGLNNTFTVS